MEENNERERIDNMPKITFPDQFEGQVRGAISQMIEKGLNSIEVSDSDGQVVVREKMNGVETSEFKERLDDIEVLMAPVKVKIRDSVETFYVCSR